MTEQGLKRLVKLYEVGQSPWYDNISRRLIQSGELKGLFAAGIKGVTSNPSIFEKAINGSDVYDEKIRRLKDEGRTVQETYDELTADDVRDAADMLKEIFEQTKGEDGYVSIEVLPAYAHDPDKTVEYAKYIFKKVGRPNILVKVPGTFEGAEAVREIIACGIGVNVTLLFSVSQYERMARAYMEGLKIRLSRVENITNIHSVASVFISRVDSKVDNLLDVFAARENNLSAKSKINFLKGKIAIANAKMIYQRFKIIFEGSNFERLKTQGGNLQRVLWGSTSTKNPAYHDCLYVESLIGKNTINTIPHQTVAAFQDHGRVALTLEDDLEGVQVYLSQLEDLEINLEKLCEDVQREGVKAFADAFDKLTVSLRHKVSS